MLDYGRVEAGAGVLTDLLTGLSDRIKLAPESTTSKKGYPEFKAAFAALATRIAVGTAKWKTGDPVTGLPWGIANSDQAAQQLNQWAEELQALWSTWSKLSGEAPITIAKPKDQLSGMGLGLGGVLGGLSDVIWAIVGLSAVGIVAYLVWRFSK